MKRNKILIILAIVAAMAVPISVFAVTSNAPIAKTVRGFFGIDSSKLTDKQKADVTDYTKKMGDLQKEFVNKMVANGSLTKVQGDAEIKKIDEAVKNGNIGELGKGRFGDERKGMKDEIDTSKLTDVQKADLTNSLKKIADAQKELINKMVSNGSMTKAQGDEAIKEIDNSVNTSKGEFDEFGCFGIKRIDTSKLTVAQKADLTNSLKKIADTQKELINKMVSNGSMTKAQGDKAILRIDDMSKNGFSKHDKAGHRESENENGNELD